MYRTEPRLPGTEKSQSGGNQEPRGCGPVQDSNACRRQNQRPPHHDGGAFRHPARHADDSRNAARRQAPASQRRPARRYGKWETQSSDALPIHDARETVNAAADIMFIQKGPEPCGFHARSRPCHWRKGQIDYGFPGPRPIPQAPTPLPYGRKDGHT